MNLVAPTPKTVNVIGVDSHAEENSAMRTVLDATTDMETKLSNYKCARCGKTKGSDGWPADFAIIHDKDILLCHDCYPGYAGIRHRHRMAMDIDLSHYVESYNANH